MYNLDKKVGNTGLMGSYFWRIDNSDGRKALEKCYTWAFLQEYMNFRFLYNRLVRRDWRMACPCSGWQVWFDRRFFWDWKKYPWPDWCLESRRSKYFFYYSPSKGFILYKMTQLCCYSTDWDDWGSLKVGPPEGSRVKVKAYYYWLNRVENVYTDLEAYKYCCVDIPFCDLFYYYRPSDNCRLYRPPRRRKFTLQFSGSVGLTALLTDWLTVWLSVLGKSTMNIQYTIAIKLI